MAGLSALSGMSADQIKNLKMNPAVQPGSAKFIPGSKTNLPGNFVNALGGEGTYKVMAGRSLNTQFPTGAPKLSLGAPQGSQWGVGRDGGFVWHGQGPAPQMTNDQILADMGFMSSRGGWNPNGGGLNDPSQALAATTGTVSTAVQPGSAEFIPGTTTNPNSGQQYGLSGAEDALQRGLQGGIAGIEAGVNQATNTLSPYTQGGSGAFDYASALSGALGADAQQAAFSRYTESPEVAYQREQAEKAILRNASATGGLGGGNVLQALQRNAIGLAQQDYGNSFNRLMGLGEMGQGSSNLLAGIQANAGTKVGDYAYGTGGQMAGYRTRAGEQIAGNVQDTTSALSGLINQQGTDLSNIIGQQGSNIANLLAQYGVSDAQSMQSLAALLANIATGSASNVAGVPGLPNTNDTGILGGLAALLGGAGGAMEGYASL